MVQLKRHGRIYFFWILILFVFSGCSKCVQNKVADFAFSPDELLINPYVEGDTLLFTSENQDSIVYICTKRELRRSKYYEISYEDAKLYHDDCMGDYYETDGDLTILEGSDSSAGIAISLSFLNSFLHPTDAKEISL